MVRFATPPTTWTQVHAGYPNEIVALTKKLRKVVVSTLSDCTESVRGAKMMGYAQYWRDDPRDVMAMISPEDDQVKLYVHHIRKDATGTLHMEGTGKSVRHVKLRPGQLDVKAVASLLEQVRDARG